MSILDTLLLTHTRFMLTLVFVFIVNIYKCNSIRVRIGRMRLAICNYFTTLRLGIQNSTLHCAITTNVVICSIVIRLLAHTNGSICCLQSYCANGQSLLLYRQKHPMTTDQTLIYRPSVPLQCNFLTVDNGICI